MGYPDGIFVFRNFYHAGYYTEIAEIKTKAGAIEDTSKDVSAALEVIRRQKKSGKHDFKKKTNEAAEFANQMEGLWMVLTGTGHVIASRSYHLL